MIKTYKKCPHCKKLIGIKYGHAKALGNPITTCTFCGHVYIDEDIIDWAISPVEERISYYFANNRGNICIWVYFLSILFLSNQILERGLIVLLYPLPLLAVVISLCVLHARRNVKKVICESRERAQNIEYLRILHQANYPIDAKFLDDNGQLILPKDN